jgi:quercetin dioxygenase-like cupin family protein
VTQTFLKRGALGPQHAHPTEQFIYVLQGALRTRVGEDAVTVREGEVLQVPAGAGHQLEALDDTFVLDIKGTEAP